MPTSIQPEWLPSASHLDVDWDSRAEPIAWDTAITLAYLSTVAYSAAHIRHLLLHLIGFDTIELADVGAGSGFVAFAGDIGVVAFRGTDDLEDWLSNFDMLDRVALGDSREVHRGFQRRYNDLAGTTRPAIQTRQPRRLWITGHSLGGAMAACCTLDLIARQTPFTGLVTFGQPRIGNEVLARHLDAETQGRYLRFVNQRDPVPLAPPGLGLTLPDYWHCGDRIRFAGDQLDRGNGLAMFSCTAPAEDGGSADSVPPIPDGEESLTEDQFHDLQNQLRTRRQLGLTEGGSTEEVGASPETVGATADGSAFGDWIGVLVGDIKSRINDHSTDEYLRAMHEFRAGTR